MGSRYALCHFNVTTVVACSFDKEELDMRVHILCAKILRLKLVFIIDSYCVVVCSSSLCSPWPHIEADWLNRCPLVFRALVDLNVGRCSSADSFPNSQLPASAQNRNFISEFGKLCHHILLHPPPKPRRAQP